MDFPKPFYSTTEAAKIFNVNASLLRYWEKEFAQLKPYKNKKGDRYFRAEDMATIETIYHLTKVKGFTLQGAKDELRRERSEDAGQARAVASLERVRERLLALRDRL